jgi:thiamine biosynthesis lipoprotein ApbE
LCQGLVVNFGGDLTVRGRDLNQNDFEIGIFNPEHGKII